MNQSILRDASIVLPDRIISHGTVRIADGRIESISESETGTASGAEIFDLDGLTLLPGFIDVHIHGAVGVDVMEATPAGLQDVSRFLASQGVTAWLPTFVPASDDNYASAVTAITEAMNGPGARMLGVHYEGPFVNTAQ